MAGPKKGRQTTEKTQVNMTGSDQNEMRHQYQCTEKTRSLWEKLFRTRNALRRDPALSDQTFDRSDSPVDDIELKAAIVGGLTGLHTEAADGSGQGRARVCFRSSSHAHDP